MAAFLNIGSVVPHGPSFRRYWCGCLCHRSILEGQTGSNEHTSIFSAFKSMPSKTKAEHHFIMQMRQELRMQSTVPTHTFWCCGGKGKCSASGTSIASHVVHICEECRAAQYTTRIERRLLSQFRMGYRATKNRCDAPGEQPFIFCITFLDNKAIF